MDTDSFIVYVKKMILQKILKLGLTIQMMSWTNHYRKEKTRKFFGVMKDELGGKTMKEFLGSRE